MWSKDRSTCIDIRPNGRYRDMNSMTADGRGLPLEIVPRKQPLARQTDNATGSFRAKCSTRTIGHKLPVEKAIESCRSRSRRCY